MVGPETIARLQKYHANTAFLSVGGIGEEGASKTHRLVVEVDRVMLDRAERAILLADHSKFGRRQLVPECSWEEVDALVTNSAPEAKYRTRLGERLIVAMGD
ncbi:MAG: hypothetical protein LV481_01465 [Methylacidiphilales bacterium]|nr:hypothetical protein [Candidatus Methylacidiphilales bacterium]